MPLPVLSMGCCHGSGRVQDTWRVNNTAGDEPLYPYKGAVIIRHVGTPVPRGVS